VQILNKKMKETKKSRIKILIGSPSFPQVLN
jgi:hypothetical protein